ncbi:MAG: sigma-54 dependent transcriptional regulator [Planctomycetota bacterium]|nr:sigma-54 dependent transcriptional regulator [Planctomycetota bacterium]
MTLKRVLIIHADSASRDLLTETVTSIGCLAEQATDWEGARKRLRNCQPDIVLTDGRTGGPGHMPLVEAIHQECPELPVILVGNTEAAAPENARWTTEVLPGSVSAAALEWAFSRIEENRRLKEENAYLRGEVDGDADTPMVAKSPRMLECLRTAARIARSTGTVLVTGECGTGKERLARTIHRLSPRRNGPYIRVHCAAHSPEQLEIELFGCEQGKRGARSGRFELADGGTLVLDEIGELPPELQERLLRVLEEKELERVGGTASVKVDVRVIATTSRNLPVEVAAERFREDLYYRLHILPLAVAPLRARHEDIAPLAEHFIERTARLEGHSQPSLSIEARERLVEWPWPGNVSELERVIQRTVVLTQAETLEAGDLCLEPTGHAHKGNAKEDERLETPAHPERELGQRLANLRMADIERYAILATLESTGGNKTEAGRRLGLTARTLSNKLKLWKSAGLVA